MTLLDSTTRTAPITTTADPATTKATAAPRTARLQHPTFGRAEQATVSPITMELYRVSVAGAVIGYLEAAGPIWVALRGDLYPRAVEVGQHRLFAAALRTLTNPA